MPKPQTEKPPAKPDEHDYPEHTKLKAISHLSQSNHDFVEWLGEEKGIVLAQRFDGSDDYYPTQYSLRKLLAEFHEIDLDVIEDEKRAMLDRLREANDA